LGVLEDHSGRLAAELKARARESLGGDCSNLTTGRGAARKCDLVHARMAYEVFPDFASRGNQVENARRKAGRLDALRQNVRIERRFWRGFRYQRATGRQRR